MLVDREAIGSRTISEVSLCNCTDPLLGDAIETRMEYFCSDTAVANGFD